MLEHFRPVVLSKYYRPPQKVEATVISLAQRFSREEVKVETQLLDNLFKYKVSLILLIELVIPLFITLCSPSHVVYLLFRRYFCRIVILSWVMMTSGPEESI